MMWGYEGGWMGGWGLHWLVPAIFVGILVWLVLVLARGCDRAGAAADPESILKARYARGELTREQYEQMRRDVA